LTCAAAEAAHSSSPKTVAEMRLRTIEQLT